MLETATGNAMFWNLDADGMAYTMVLSVDTIYAGEGLSIIGVNQESTSLL